VAEVKKWRVFVHEGADFPALSKASGGLAWLDDDGLHIELQDRQITVERAAIEGAEVYMRGPASVIRLSHRGGVIHFAIVRFMVGDIFAMVNRLATRRLQKELAACAPNP
jgi:hypothetical protein